MKKIMTLLMCLAVSLCVCGMVVAPVAAEEGVKICMEDSDCDNLLGRFCTSRPYCNKSKQKEETVYGECAFEDPCQQYSDTPVCDPVADVCVVCVEDRDCRRCDIDNDQDTGSDFDRGNCDSDDTDGFDSDWEGNYDEPYCLDQECVECTEDSDCPNGGECNDDNVCIECDTNEDCIENNNGEDFCSADFKCEECLVDDDCPIEGNRCITRDEADSERDSPAFALMPENGSPSESGSDLICSGEPECETDEDCNSGTAYPDEFCAAPGYCNENGTCDNESTVCERIWGFTASACVEEDRKCTACLYNEDGSGDTTCAATWEDLSTGTNYPVNDDDYDSSDSGYPGYGMGVFDNATGDICTDGGDCVECLIDADCPALFCEGTATCLDNNTCSYSGIDPCIDDNSTPDMCRESDDSCVDCLEVGDCPASENYCNGTATCNADGLGTCGFSGNPCPRTCLPDTQKCDDCKSDADCVGPDFEGRPFCQTSDEFDPDTNSCTGCKTDADCEGNDVCDLDTDNENGIETPGYPQNDSGCAECLEDEDCLDPALPECVERVCVECDYDSDCPDDKPECEDNVCVECDEDSDCAELLEDNIFAPCLKNPTCNDNLECEYTNPCDTQVCYPAGYYNDEYNRDDQNWAKGQKDPYLVDYFCTDCLSDEDCSDGQFCNGPESCIEGSCADSAGSPCADGELCSEATDECLDVECLEDTDCMFFEECDAQNECVATTPTCGLKISPKSVKADKIIDGKQKLKIKGVKGQSFDANAEIYFSDAAIVEPAGSVTVKKDTRKSLLEAVGVIDEGTTLTIRLGDCEGTVEVK